MSRSVIRFQPKFVTWLLTFASVAAVVSVVVFPSQAFEASLRGLGLWWNLVFPALLPFFILCEIVVAYGFTNALGGLLSPAARRLFRLPSLAGSALAAGMLAGTPAGTEAAVKLRRAGKITRQEAERITATSHFANPILMLTVVAAAFLHRPWLGPFIASVHYGSLFLCGMLVRYAGTGRRRTSDSSMNANPVFETEQRRSFGKVMGDGVADSLHKLMQIGGTIIVFSVAMQLAAELGLSGIFVTLMHPIASHMGIPDDAVLPVIAGMFEVHLGAFAIAQTALTASLPLKWALALICAVLGWGGLAVHLQVRALLHETDIRSTPFFLARIVQAGIAFGLALLLWEPYERWFPHVQPSFRSAFGHIGDYPEISFWPSYIPHRQALLWVMLILVLLLFATRLRKR